VYDENGEPRNMTAEHFQLLVRKLKIFAWFDRLQFSNFIDIASGFDCFPDLVRERYGVPAYYSDLAHAMNLPFGADGRLDCAVTLNLSGLPFADGAFDLVLCSEVLEHLVRPVEAIAELLRITRKYLVMTSLEALKWGRLERAFFHHRVDVRQPHIERNFLLIREFEAIFGRDLHHENLFYFHDLPENPMYPDARRRRKKTSAFSTLKSRDALVSALGRAVRYRGYRPGAAGILLVKAMPGAEVLPACDRHTADLANWVVEQTATMERRARERAAAVAEGSVPLPAPSRPAARQLLDVVRCPDCRQRLAPAEAGLCCKGCQAIFPVEYGVPILYPRSSRDTPALEADCLNQICGGDVQRRDTVRKLMHWLRRNEPSPGLLRRVAWAIDGRLIRFFVPVLDGLSAVSRWRYPHTPR
jgi:SAM-dependent methyltransferase/uncharacterized protein YbaR (Trm112 family)